MQLYTLFPDAVVHIFFIVVSQFHEELNKIQETTERAECVLMELGRAEDFDRLVPDHDVVVR